MRIKQNFHCDSEGYSAELQQRVQQVFEYSSHIDEVKKILNEIKMESADLYNLFITEEEQNKKIEAMNSFDQRMQTMINCTFNNMKKYQEFGWKELIYDGDIDDETVNKS